ncbi:hypothetical protein [Stygiolobus caldivivus]|uniref:Uncharacterized protein n=1 Tax=Stygiolobus caldivivus TaxID=2824673 RepID=A0A8D5ZHU8_9CREN|nr:hypothetical protein [Stygiolobus caldivivus]BCU70019.1 hypothetical protein KN1_13160 [Stygiolobus caldivivus]
MPSEKIFSLEYIEDGLVDWERAIETKNYIDDKIKREVAEDKRDKEDLYRFESRKIGDLQQATEKISKGLLLIYGGIALLPFLIVAGLRDFDIRHPREMEMVINEAKEFFRKSSILKEVEGLGHTPISGSSLKKLLELIQHIFRKYLRETDLAKCYKQMENFITSGLKYKRWYELWKIVIECEKSNLSKFNSEILQIFNKCLNGELEACNQLGLNDERFRRLTENPYITSFSIKLSDILIKEVFDLILVTSYLEPLSTITRYGASSGLQQNRKELLDDAIENQDKIMNFLEPKINLIKNLLKNDETLDNLSYLYEKFKDI